jgi:hypothetical protein
MRLNSKDSGLPTRTIIEKIDANTIALVINRKSRIIMTDGKKILEKVNLIKSTLPTANVELITTAPICSKTKTFLEGEGVQIIQQ